MTRNCGQMIENLFIDDAVHFLALLTLRSTLLGVNSDETSIVVGPTALRTQGTHTIATLPPPSLHTNLHFRLTIVFVVGLIMYSVCHFPK